MVVGTLFSYWVSVTFHLRTVKLRGVRCAMKKQRESFLCGKPWEVPVIKVNLISGILAAICGKVYLPYDLIIQRAIVIHGIEQEH